MKLTNREFDNKDPEVKNRCPCQSENFYRRISVVRGMSMVKGVITILSIPFDYTVLCDPGTTGWGYHLMQDRDGGLWYHIPFGLRCIILGSKHIEDDARPGNMGKGLIEEPDSIEV